MTSDQLVSCCYAPKEASEQRQTENFLPSAVGFSGLVQDEYALLHPEFTYV
jgi:hypothetical protein